MWGAPEALYGPDYFERGADLGLSCYRDFRWLPERSLGEARAFLAALSPGPQPPTPGPCLSVTDYGCAKGFLVRAFLALGCDARGVDVSPYALGCATLGTGGRLHTVREAAALPPTRLGTCKDVLEHCRGAAELHLTLQLLARLARRWLVVVPLGEGGCYRIPEYELDVTHVLRKPEGWWAEAFDRAGLRREAFAHEVPGLKEHWTQRYPTGNGFYTLTSLALERSPS